MSKTFKKVREYVPLGAMIMFLLTVISFVLLLIVKKSVLFADFFNYHLSSAPRFLIAKLTSWIPFSLAEILIISIPIWACILIAIAIKKSKKSIKSSVRYLCFVICIVCFIFNAFVWTYSSGYHTSTIDKKLDLDRQKINADDLYQTALWLTENINSIAPKIKYDENGASVMEYSYFELSDKICKSYEKFADNYKIIKTFKSNVKPILLSEPFTYTHISGIYSFMTGESNINTNYPDYIVASSATHEMAHQRGIAREDEANFIAFLVCITSDDAFLQYSGYLDVYQSVMNALYSADKELYKDAFQKLCYEAYMDRLSYAEFFKKYADSKTSEVSGALNDSFLHANGQEAGIKSYGMVTDLTVAYYKSKILSAN